MDKLKKGNSYLIKHYNIVRKWDIIEVTQKAYKVKNESGNYSWEDISDLHYGSYGVLEDLGAAPIIIPSPK